MDGPLYIWVVTISAIIGLLALGTGVLLFFPR